MQAACGLAAFGSSRRKRRMRVTLDWLGVATFRLTLGERVIFLDAYMDRVPAAPAVGLTAAEVTRADYVLVGHSHFDHLWGAERIAARTGAAVIGSHETVRLLHDVDAVAEEQLIAVAGGEPLDLGDGIRVRVYPSLHSCIWAHMGATADEACLGDRAAPPADGRPLPPRRLDAAAHAADRRRADPPRARHADAGRPARGDGLPGGVPDPRLTALGRPIGHRARRPVPRGAVPRTH